MIRLFKIAGLITLLIVCNFNQKGITGQIKAQTLYFNGDILTMEGDEPEYVEAVVVKEGKITFTGTLAEAEEKSMRIVMSG